MIETISNINETTIVYGVLFLAALCFIFIFVAVPLYFSLYGQSLWYSIKPTYLMHKVDGRVYRLVNSYCGCKMSKPFKSLIFEETHENIIIEPFDYNKYIPYINKGVKINIKNIYNELMNHWGFLLATLFVLLTASLTYTLLTTRAN